MNEQNPDNTGVPPFPDEGQRSILARHRLLECLDVVADAARALQSQEPGTDEMARALDVTMRAIGDLIDFHVFGIALFDEGGLDWKLTRCVPSSGQDTLLAEMAHQTDTEFLGWAISQNKPMVTASTIPGKRVLMHPVGTQKRVMGFFLGVCNEPVIPDASQKLISIVLIYCANIIEAEQLYLENLTRRQSEQRLEKLSQQDGLTGLANRRHFDTALETELRRAARTNTSLSLLLLDADSFKVFNDTFGHQQGDEALRMIAEKARLSAKRAGDLSARYGGEEFAVLLPATDEKGACTVAEKIRRAIAEHALPIPDSLEPAHLTVSIGAATVPETGRATSAELLGAADRALYKAKGSGKNRVVSVAL